MSRPTQAEFDRLRIVAGEIMMTLEAEGHAVGTALAHNAAFRRNRLPASVLKRSLVLEGARRGATRAQIFADDVNTGVELISVDENVERRYRVKTATYRNGEPHIVVGLSSSLLSLTQEPESLLTTERWVFCFKLDEDAIITEIFVAEIVGHEGEGPVTLTLGPTYPLEPITSPDGFVPDHDDDLGEDFDSDSESGEGVA